uniref:Uncharacterized protein n=1 Tax=Anopheles albimanus TaxID=7167 RepID=A0A182FL73_ANOAL
MNGSITAEDSHTPDTVVPSLTASRQDLGEQPEPEYVSRQQYNRLLADYNSLKQRYEANGRSPSPNGQRTSLDACLERIERFECLMRNMQEDFRDVKASVRSHVGTGAPKIHTVRGTDVEENPINFVMTIVHPRRPAAGQNVN